MWKIILIASAVFGLDQLTKWAAVKYLAEAIQVIENVLQFKLFYNHGIAFSISIPQTIIITLTYIMLIIGVYFAYQELNLKNWYTQILLGVIMGGTLGNLFDRALQGSVVDFIAVANYPVFNIADIGITVGLFCIVIFFERLRKKKV
ncbi:MAG: signal peptidase II [Patescibacteria group bacterium]